MENNNRLYISIAITALVFISTMMVFRQDVQALCIGSHDYCEGYHNGAKAVDREDAAGLSLGFHGCPSGHNQEYCNGYERGYDDEVRFYM